MQFNVQQSVTVNCHDDDSVFTSDPSSASLTAIIVPYRNREAHLHKFVEYMHLYLRNEIDYRIYVVHQVRFYSELMLIEKKTFGNCLAAPKSFDGSSRATISN